MTPWGFLQSLGDQHPLRQVTDKQTTSEDVWTPALLTAAQSWAPGFALIGPNINVGLSLTGRSRITKDSASIRGSQTQLNDIITTSPQQRPMCMTTQDTLGDAAQRTLPLEQTPITLAYYHESAESSCPCVDRNRIQSNLSPNLQGTQYKDLR